MRVYSILIQISLAAVFTLLVFAAWYNRPSADDFAYLADVRDMGVWKTSVFSFQTWNTRFTSIFVSALGLWLYELSGTFLFEQVLAYSLLLFGIHKLLQEVLPQSAMQTDRFVYTACTFLALFIITPSVSETWLWHISYSMYFLPLIAGIWMAYLLIREDNSRANTFALLAITAYFFMASEFWSIFLIITLSGLFSLNPGFAKNKRNIMIQIVLLLCVGLVVMALGEGRAIRSSQLPEMNFQGAFTAGIKGTGALLIKYILLKLPFIICLAIPFLILAHQSDPKGDIKTGKRALIAIGLWLIVVGINHFGLAIMLHEAGPLRARAISAFLFIPLAFYLVWLVGIKLRDKDLKLRKWIVLPSIIILLVSLSSFLITLPKHKNYAKEFDARLVLLSQLNQQSTGITEVKVRHLPSSGLIYSNDIQLNEDDYRNKALRRYLRLKFPVILKEEIIEKPS